MKESEYKSAGECFNYLETGGGPPLHFAHANGFPAGTYGPLLDTLAERFHVLANNSRALGLCSAGREAREREKPRAKNWFDLADEMNAFIERVVGKPVIGVGHSMGGTITMLASARRPDLFKRLVLLDPVILSPKILRLVRLLTIFGLSHKAPLAAGALKRRNKWQTREEALDYFRSKPLFDGWDERMLLAYVECGLTEAEDGFELTYAPGVEAFIFGSAPPSTWRQLRRASTPTLVVRGTESDVLTGDTWGRLKRVKPEFDYVEYENHGHLFPMKTPEKVVDSIFRYNSML